MDCHPQRAASQACVLPKLGEQILGSSHHFQCSGVSFFETLHSRALILTILILTTLLSSLRLALITPKCSVAYLTCTRFSSLMQAALKGGQSRSLSQIHSLDRNTDSGPPGLMGRLTACLLQAELKRNHKHAVTPPLIIRQTATHRASLGLMGWPTA